MDRLKKKLNSIKPHHWATVWAFILVAATIGYGGWYGYQQLTLLTSEIRTLNQELASTTALLQENIDQTENTLSQALSQEKERLNQEIQSTKQEIGSVSGTVTTLEKLSKTDPELLQKYSKVFFLNEHYAPERVTTIPSQYTYYESRTYVMYDKVWPYLEDMLQAAASAGEKIYVISAYRGFDEQSALKTSYTITYGEGTANQFSADQGYSEHQLGTTVDLITTGIGGTVEGFETTPAYQWLRNNAHKYGFVLSYPDNNGFYVFEPWHWRFVGTKLATYLHNTNQYFYDLDQRTIDEYLVSIFD